MSALAKTLLSEYYGVGETSGTRRFLSIPQCIENVQNDEEKLMTEQTSITTNEENPSEKESQKEDDAFDKSSSTNEVHVIPLNVSNDFNEEYDTDENSDTFKNDLGDNIIFYTSDDAPQSMVKKVPSDNVLLSNIKTVLDTLDAEIIEGNDLSLTFPEDTIADTISDISSIVTSKKSQIVKIPSLKTPTPTPSVPKKEPVCNETFVDISSTGLKKFPIDMLNKFPKLQMLYLENNELSELPIEIFTSLRNLEWLDVRNNQLTTVPGTIKFHPCLQTLLLQGNKIEILPLELCLVPNLKTLHVTQNPLVVPPRDIVSLGCTSILNFLRIEWNKLHPEEQVFEPPEKKIEPKASTILCYRSPRSEKKNLKIMQLKNSADIRDPSKTMSIREKSKSYRPSNRYSETKCNISLTSKSIGVSSENVRFVPFCDSCRQELINTNSDDETNEIINAGGGKTPLFLEVLCSSKHNRETCRSSKINEISDKILLLPGPSPRSHYIRKNIPFLRTYFRQFRKECQAKCSDNKFDDFDTIKAKKNFTSKRYSEKNTDGEKLEKVFDVITNDGKLLKIRPMRLKNTNWMLSWCKNTGTNTLMEQRLLWMFKVKEIIMKQALKLQKIKDESVLKEWRRDRRSFSKAIEKAMKRTEDDIPFAIDFEDYSSVLKRKPKLESSIGSRKKEKPKFIPPANINKKICELMESLSKLQVAENINNLSPRTEQKVLKEEIGKILQFQDEILYLRKYNDIVIAPFSS